MRDLTVAKTIVQQLGGNRRLELMVGARNFGATDKSVTFQFKGSTRANAVTVILEPSDTYRIKFYKMRRFTAKVVYETEDIYCDMLVDVFERHTGLRLSL